jgi:hypothetical protein
MSDFRMESFLFFHIYVAVNDATCTWSGQLPPRCQNNAPLSCKIFLGGVPWDIDDQTLYAAFKPFGSIRYSNHPKAGLVRVSNGRFRPVPGI